MINTELLQQTLTYITDHPEEHHQESWLTQCGTPSCFAGWACALGGLQTARVANGGSIFFEDTKCVARDADGHEKYVRAAAEELLGLTRAQSYALFHGDNTLEMIELMVKDLTNDGDLREWNDYARETNLADAVLDDD